MEIYLNKNSHKEEELYSKLLRRSTVTPTNEMKYVDQRYGVGFSRTRLPRGNLQNLIIEGSSVVASVGIYVLAFDKRTTEIISKFKNVYHNDYYGYIMNISHLQYYDEKEPLIIFSDRNGTIGILSFPNLELKKRIKVGKDESWLYNILVVKNLRTPTLITGCYRDGCSLKKGQKTKSSTTTEGNLYRVTNFIDDDDIDDIDKKKKKNGRRRNSYNKQQLHIIWPSRKQKYGIRLIHQLLSLRCSIVFSDVNNTLKIFEMETLKVRYFPKRYKREIGCLTSTTPSHSQQEEYIITCGKLCGKILMWSLEGKVVKKFFARTGISSLLKVTEDCFLFGIDNKIKMLRLPKEEGEEEKSTTKGKLMDIVCKDEKEEDFLFSSDIVSIKVFDHSKIMTGGIEDDELKIWEFQKDVVDELLKVKMEKGLRNNESKYQDFQTRRSFLMEQEDCCKINIAHSNVRLTVPKICM